MVIILFLRNDLRASTFKILWVLAHAMLELIVSTLMQSIGSQPCDFIPSSPPCRGHLVVSETFLILTTGGGGKERGRQ